MKFKILMHNILFNIIVLMVALSVYKVDGVYSDPKVLISNMMIIVFSLIFMVIGDKYNYSLNKIFMLFSFFFFGIAPAIQYQKGVILWGRTHYTSNDYFKMNLLIIFILVIYQLLYSLFTKIKGTKLERLIIMHSNQEINISSIKLLVIAIFSFLISLYVYNFSLTNLLLRGGHTILTNQSISLIYSNFIRPIPAICLFLFKINSPKKRWMEVILWIILLITNFPTSAARFYIGTLYIPILIIYFKRINQNYLLLNKIIMIGFLIIFPFLDQVRRITVLEDLTFSLDFDMFSQGHFDSYQMFMHVVVEDIITFGKQLVSSMLFFIPRSVWSGKSVGSGAFVANKYNFFFSNISMNYFGEGYINFGYLGILIFIIIIAYFNSRYDKMFWMNLDKSSPLKVFYLLSLGLQFFFLRGDMLSGTAFFTGIFVSLLFTSKFVINKD